MLQYVDYIKELDVINMHPYLNNLYENISFECLPNTIFYGKKGIGKYSQVLNVIKKFSKSKLNYNKKVIVPLLNKEDYVIRISDIHYEVDMSLLGCNSRSLWSDIYNQIIDIIMSSPQKRGIILCKNFEKINPELLESLYCYVNEITQNIQVKFFFISTNISFIMPSLLHGLEIISLREPRKKNIGKINNKIMKLDKDNKLIDNLYSIIIESSNSVKLFDLREALYNILLFQLDIYEVFYIIIQKLYDNNLLSQKQLNNTNTEIVKFSKLYNNNYRPIFHLEKLALYLIKATSNFK